MKKYRRVTRFVHIRVPGDPTAERMEKIRRQYESGDLDIDRVLIGIIDVVVDRPYTVAACYSCKSTPAGADVQDVAEQARKVISAALPNSDPAVLVTSARYVVAVVQQAKGRRRKMAVLHTDDREAKERRNRSWFDTDLWSVHTHWRLKSWCRPRLVIYDYDGNDGRKVWSWVFHLGPWWFIRERYGL